MSPFAHPMVSQWYFWLYNFWEGHPVLKLESSSTDNYTQFHNCNFCICTPESVYRFKCSIGPIDIQKRHQQIIIRAIKPHCRPDVRSHGIWLQLKEKPHVMPGTQSIPYNLSLFHLTFGDFPFAVSYTQSVFGG